MRLRWSGCAPALFGAGLMLAGCSAPPASVRIGAAAAPAASDPANPDGLYDGTSTRYLATGRDCPHPGLVEFDVQDRQFTYRWAWGTDVPAVVQPDGSVTGENGPVQLRGQLVGTKMTGNLTNGACALHFTVRRRFRGA